MKNITYYSDGKGNWTKITWSKQCPEKTIFGKCQGVKGHKGDHWCYSPDGSYNYAVQGKLKPHETAGGMIPPNNEKWISPVNMNDKFYMNFHENSKVTDPELISRLNKGEMKKNESIDRPVDLNELDPEIIKRLNS